MLWIRKSHSRPPSILSPAGCGSEQITKTCHSILTSCSIDLQTFTFYTIHSIDSVISAGPSLIWQPAPCLPVYCDRLLNSVTAVFVSYKSVDCTNLLFAALADIFTTAHTVSPLLFVPRKSQECFTMWSMASMETVRPGKLSVDLNLCVCVSFQLAAETAHLHGQSVSCVRRRSIGVPLRRGDVRKLQSLLQKSRGRYGIGSGHRTGRQKNAARRHETDRRKKHTIFYWWPQNWWKHDTLEAGLKVTRKVNSLFFLGGYI